jgi:hypothetical protein
LDFIEGGSGVIKHKPLLSILIVFCLLAGYLPINTGKAVASEYNIVCTTKNGIFYVKTADEALDALEKAGGGNLRIQHSMEFSTIELRELSESMKIIIPESVQVTIGGAGLKGAGSIEVYGTLDLKNSSCATFHVTGEMETVDQGKIIRETATVTMINKTSETALTIAYGQTLPSAPVSDALVGKKVYRSGNWYYCDQSVIYEVGVHTISVFYDYIKTIYSPTAIESDVLIRVEKAVPQILQNGVPEVECGEKAADVDISYSFVNPYTNEPVPGTLTYEEPDMILDSPGKKLLKATFVPEDERNYDSTEVSLEVLVVPIEPQVVSAPTASQGMEEQRLCDITLGEGICVNPRTGESLSGTWSWLDENSALILGESSYLSIFTPEDTVCYRQIEVPVIVETLPIRAVAVTPEATAYQTATEAPTEAPTERSEVRPTEAPTERSEVRPTEAPTERLESSPTEAPTEAPTERSEVRPTEAPTERSEVRPTEAPTERLESSPTEAPTQKSAKSPESGSGDSIVIKKMVSKISKIKTTTSEKILKKRSKIKSIQHSGQKIKVVIKKEKKVKYEARISTRKDMKMPRKKTSSKQKIVFRKLRKGQIYYVQSRVWIEKQGKHTYSKWSKKKKVRL